MYDRGRKRTIYDSTGGYCHLCHAKVCFKNHGIIGARGAWHVDHSNPRAKGGGDSLQNLKPACIPCNTSKGAGSTRAARARNGVTAAPPSRQERRRKGRLWTILGLGTLALIVGVPLGWVAIGALAGSTSKK